jgi:hypothetical protein
MSTAYYPQGMRSMPAGGRIDSSLPGQYVSWKGSGVLSNPIGVASTHIRPLTNNDSGNVFQSGSFESRAFGKGRVFIPRPIKHYRKGRVIPSTPIMVVNPSNPTEYMETELINYNMNRVVTSSKGTSLGGGFGGSGLLNDLQDKPGSFVIKENTLDELSNVNNLNKLCNTCEGVGIVSSYYPNNLYLTDNPEPKTQTSTFCCNEQRKAKRRAIYASTNLKKNYYTTTKQYLQNRCQTYDQKAFNFQSNFPTTIEQMSYEMGVPINQIINAKPGSPLTTFNTYKANCYPNAEIYDSTEIALVTRLLTILLDKKIITQEQINYFKSLNNYNFDKLFEYLNGLPEDIKTIAIDEFVLFINNPYWGVPFAGPTNQNGCKLTTYKPNNPQFAKQGAVSSSTRILKLTVDTISTNAASIQNNNNTGQELVTANEIYRGNDNNVQNLLKNKVPNCNSPTVYPFQNKKICSYRNLQSYQLPRSQPSPYRYYIGTVFSSNHFSQTPRTYNTTTRSIQK